LANFDASSYTRDLSLNLKCERCLISKDEDKELIKIIRKEIIVNNKKRI
jgi:hypothetical protein